MRRGERIAALLHAFVLAGFGCAIAVVADAFAQRTLFAEQPLRFLASGMRWSQSPRFDRPPQPLLKLVEPSQIAQLGIFCAVIQLLLFIAVVGAHRRSAPSIAPEIAPATWHWPAAALVLSPAALAGFALVMAARTDLTLQGFWLASTGAGGPAAERASKLAEAISELLNLPPMFMLFGGPQAALCLGACAGALLYFAKRAGRPAPSPVAVGAVGALAVGMGLLPLWVGALTFSYQLIRGFGSIAQLPAEAKVATLVVVLDEAHFVLDGARILSLAGIAIATLAAVVLFAIAPGAKRDPVPPPANTRSASLVLMAGGCVLILAFSAWSFAGASPFRDENRQPLPTVLTSVTMSGTHEPTLAGPDALEIAPILDVEPVSIALDGRHVDPDALGADLGTLRRNWGILHPQGTFGGTLAVICDGDVPLTQLARPLLVAHGAGYVRPMFALGGWVAIRRPVFGILQEPRFSAVRFELIEGNAPPSDPSLHVLDLDPASTCAALIRSVLAQRKAGRRVAVRLPRADP